ncbi:hypothetical protein [Actinomadura rudentiformis]|uniref:Uncharacterized protein n=1 Tax=Actinomadura rudentiformis TaxID=359158 RepID=A0A6H9YXI5_9ACTN|nr:hypothetical protein [Actinomadura rudentiformis]KAB2347314.1 hypothetical protein F8566_20085 [Actinomadura rudentiformis]
MAVAPNDAECLVERFAAADLVTVVLVGSVTSTWSCRFLVLVPAGSRFDDLGGDGLSFAVTDLGNDAGEGGPKFNAHPAL